MSTKVKEGYLLKFSPGLVKGWKNKYFVLYNDGQLAYFDQKGGARSGHINVRTCKDIQVGAGIQSKLPRLPNGYTVDCLFSLITNKKYLLLANSRQDLDSWMQVLNTSGRVAASTSYPTSQQPPVGGYPQAGYNKPQSGVGTLGFEALDLGTNHQPGYPPQGGYPPQTGYPQQGGYPQQSAYPPQQPGYPPQQPGYAPQPGYPPTQPGYPPQQPGYAPQQYPQYPPQGQYPAQPYGAPGYNQYPQGGAYGYQQQQPKKSHKGGGMGGMLGGLGGAAAGLGAMGLGKKAMKHKKLVGGLGAAMLGGYALKKASSGWSLGSNSWGSGGSFGSFGSFGSGCS